jgi:hypothetical protein
MGRKTNEIVKGGMMGYLTLYSQLWGIFYFHFSCQYVLFHLFFVCVCEEFFEIGSYALLVARLALNHDPPDLCLLSS